MWHEFDYTPDTYSFLKPSINNYFVKTNRHNNTLQASQ